MSSNMRVRTQKFIHLAVAPALAVANGIPSRHAQAGMHPYMTPVAATRPYDTKPHHHETGQAAHHPHHNDHERGRTAAQVVCHNDGQGFRQPNSPLHNCCVASCSSVAFIFASFVLGAPQPNADYGVVPPLELMPVLLASADPPPR
jgi:hypothetical protein